MNKFRPTNLITQIKWATSFKDTITKTQKKIQKFRIFLSTKYI